MLGASSLYSSETGSFPEPGALWFVFFWQGLWILSLPVLGCCVTKLSSERDKPHLLTPDRTPMADQNMDTKVHPGEPASFIGVACRSVGERFQELHPQGPPQPGRQTSPKLGNLHSTAQPAGSSMVGECPLLVTLG